MTLFTKIINREIPAEIIWENEDFIAFMDIFPLSEGHVLVCPKKEIDYIFDLSQESYDGLFFHVKGIAEVLKKTFSVERVCLIVEGFEVPHVHVHLVPTNVGLAELQRPEKPSYDLREVADKIRSLLD